MKKTLFFKNLNKLTFFLVNDQTAWDRVASLKDHLQVKLRA